MYLCICLFVFVIHFVSKVQFQMSDACDGSVATQDVRSRCNFEPESDPIHNFESEPIHDFRRRIVGPVFAKIVW